MPERLKNIRTVFIALLVTAALAVGLDHLYLSDLEWQYRTSRVEGKLINLEKQAARLLEKVEMQIENADDADVMFHTNTGNDALQHDITLLVYKDDHIIYWSDNSIAFPVTYNENYEEYKPVFLSNGWFIPVHREFSGYDVLALIKIYRQYPIVNDILQSGFPEIFRLPRETHITFDKSQSEFHINGYENEFCFGLIFPERKPNTVLVIFPVIAWFIFLFLVIRLVTIASFYIAKKTGQSISVLLAFAAYLLIYAVILLTGIPPPVQSTELFLPFLWSAGRLLPSIGHALLLGIFIISGIKLLFRSGSFNLPWTGKGIWKIAVPWTIFAIGFISFLIIASYFRDLVNNSAISFEAFKILDISFMSLAGFTSVMLFLTVPAVLFLKACRMMKEWPLKANITVIITSATVLLLACFPKVYCNAWGIAFIILLALTVLLWERKKYSGLSLIVVFSILTGIFATGLIINYSELKEEKNMKVMAISLANDNDMVAEGLLIDMWPLLKNDTVLTAMVSKETISAGDINAVYRYLEDYYFNGYWESYDLNIVICRNDSPLNIGTTGASADNCFTWFDQRIKEEGDPITGTGFWFMHNQTGRAWYSSRLFYDVRPGLVNGLFIELISHIETYLAGYPELLIDGSRQRFPKLKGISYAKYINGFLALRAGDYPYDNDIAPQSMEGQEYRIEKSNGFRHLYYNHGEMTLVITTEAVTFINKVITFAYLFIILLIYSVVAMIIMTRHPSELLNFDSFKGRLQLSFSAVLAVVFIIIIAGALALTTRQFRINHTRVLREKATSISIELEHILMSEKTLEQGWHTDEYLSLNHLLVKFSNVFFTDINLYSPSGTLIATSRPEVFTRKLEGNMMDPLAFGFLTDAGKDEYIGMESIGRLRYLSAYIPFYNEDNELIAYLNIPYFAMQNLLAEEVTNLVVTLVNFTLLFLVIMMWVAVFLSERITSPLHMLQQAMASVEYGKKNEHIVYKSHDEIGELVHQYNRMTDELDDSADKLARTEREMAWREMARQIAHEIKNPLTPMKLNVQQLYKWWKDEVPDFNVKLKNFTNNQIEYIDNLSNIATAFSYFARLPAARPAEVDVVAQLKTALGLFGNAENVSITFDSGNISKAFIMADKEHLNGIFSNLLKNAIQAIPSGREGLIRIELFVTGGKVQINFIDNGTGISNDLIPRMFTPNFTTKSSGMGLGLSIVKRYVETAGGSIRFKTYPGNGSTFIVEFPLLYSVK